MSDVSVVEDVLSDVLVEYEVIDGIDASSLLSSDTVYATDRGFIVDYGGEQIEIRPLGVDINGDSVQEWGIVIADNSQETALDKPFSRYTVSEAMLFIIGVFSLISLVRFCWRRHKV